MRYEKGHKDATRKHIVKVASERFRRDGVEAVGVAGLMADAGLTHGGFYSHFASKEELVRAATVDALEGGRAQLARAAIDGGLEGIVRAYLRPAHRDASARGCAFAALTPEIARHPRATRATFTGEFKAHVDLIASHLPEKDAGENQRAALAIFSLMMGALQLARAVVDKDLSDRILQSGTDAALALANAGAVARDGVSS
ncbi:TetR/AcrR family transcriptional regulator [Methylocapsa sp. S129]|uniref:TetR/AcrR family transcriptional regulator n=1 Tax=Methylocapsa sp. S129 TaxID=1641869 RepID=UPI00131CA820|nr:TetR/AcrR family transcriptional regulator [Methylocapsa sp. S129]